MRASVATRGETVLDLGDLLVFSKIVETGNLSRAGRLLGVPKSTVSRRLARLEDRLGVALFQRNSRAVTVTDDGALFFEYCKRSIGILHDGERVLQSRQDNLEGVLRMAMPRDLGPTVLAPLLAEFLASCPGLRLIAEIRDDPVTCLAQGFDLAVAPGPLADSGLIATRLGTSAAGLYGAPIYFERKGMPQSRLDLDRFDLLAATSVGRWPLRGKEGEIAFEFRPRLVCPDLMMLRAMAVAGLGIAALPAFLCHEAVGAGTLRPVLPGWTLPPRSWFAVFPDRQTLPSRLRMLIDFLVEMLRPALASGVAA